MGLTALDIIVLLLVGGGLFFGFMRGFVCEVLSLFAWVAAVVALRYFHEPATQWLTDPVGSWGGAAVLAFVLLFGITFFLGKLLSRRIGRSVRNSAVGPIDRLLGGGFGALKGLIGATLLFLAANLAFDTIWGRVAERPEWMTESRSYALLRSSADTIVDLVESRRNAGLENGAESPE
jgi:membrane protein required for colicin V production